MLVPPPGGGHARLLPGLAAGAVQVALGDQGEPQFGQAEAVERGGGADRDAALGGLGGQRHR
jgi:hypothetical protein